MNDRQTQAAKTSRPRTLPLVLTVGFLAFITFAAVSSAVESYRNGGGDGKEIAATETDGKQYQRVIVESGSIVVTGSNVVTGTVAVSSIPAVTGTVAVSSMPAVTTTVSAITAGETHVGEVGGNMSVITAELTRVSDTNAYGANDVVSNSTTTTTMLTFTNVARVNQGTGYIVGARLITDKKSITPRIRVHVYHTVTTSIAGDNVNHKEVYADIGKRVGYFDLPAMTTPADTSGSDLSRSQDFTLRIPYQTAAASRNFYVLFETLDAFTPASAEKFSLTLLTDNN